jgi:DHHC palmitoyltransferase
LLISFLVASISNPGYIEPAHEFIDLLQKVHACELCADCKVLVTPRSKHCPVCKRCVERYDHHCPWINNCVGIHNHNSFLIFIITLLSLCTIAVLSDLDTLGEECGVDKVTASVDCPNLYLCFMCHDSDYKFGIITLSLAVTIFFGFAAFALFSVHLINYIRGKTTNERFARNNRAVSNLTEGTERTTSSLLLQHNQDAEALLGGHKPRRAAKKGCWANCGQMCCNKTIMSQEELLQMHIAADTDTKTDPTSRASDAE